MSYLTRRATRPTPFRRRWKRRLASAGFVFTTAFGAPAFADEGENQFGAFVAFHFGGEGSRFGWGIEARRVQAIGDFDRCFDDSGAFAAGVVRLGFQGLGRPSLVVGAQGGGIFGDVVAANGEAALGYQWGAGQGLKLTFGGEVAARALHMRANWDALRSDGAVAAGLRLPVTYCTAIEGRPLRDADGCALPSALMVAPERAPATFEVDDLPDDAREALLAVWSQRARTEWASVPAFLQLAEQLQALEAPRELVERSLNAAEQEIHHAVMSAGVTSSLSGAPVIADSESLSLRPPTSGTEGLVRLAVESWVDGCLGEGTAAALAERARERVADPLIRQTLDMVARDEAGHAELAWQTLDWALQVDAPAVTSALRAVVRAPAPGESDGVAEGTPDFDFSAFGKLDSDAERVTAAAVTSRARARLERLLAARALG